MKAKVKATGEIVDVHRLCMSSQGDIWQKKSGEEYFAHELDFNIDGKFAENCLNVIKQDIVYNPDYWTRLEHQAAIAAMQGFLAGRMEDTYNRVAEFSIKQAHALVEKLKEERK